MPDVLNFPLQPGTRSLAVRRVDDGFIVFIAGKPGMATVNYIYLRNDGSVERVSEQHDRMHIVRIQDATS